MSFLARLGRGAGRGLSLARHAAGAHAQGSRGFAEAAAEKLDVNTNGVHGRYALALFNAGAASKELDGVTRDLAGVLQLANTSGEFAQFLDDPSVPKRTKQEVVAAALGELQAQDVTREFFSVLAENNRLMLLPKIVETYEELVSAAKGEVTAKITLAEAPDNELLEVVNTGLKDLLKSGQTLSLKVQVEPVIIGGIIIEMGDKRVDLSILSRVQRIQQLLRDTV